MASPVSQTVSHYTIKEQAASVFREFAREQPGPLLGTLGLEFTYALDGNRLETLKMLDSNPSLKAPWDFQTAYWKSVCLAMIGERKQALDCLALDVNLGMSNFPLMNKLDPFLASLRGEPRFKALMIQVKREWEHFEAQG
jgi:hypothetical protein